MVETLEMLLPMTVMSSPWALRPLVAEYIEADKPIYTPLVPPPVRRYL
jgi:hypothetical protein